MTKGRIASELRSRWTKVIEFLKFCVIQNKIEVRLKSGSSWTEVGLKLDSSQTSDPVELNSSSGEVELKIKKFRERQSKLKSNLPSTFRQPSVNLPLERERDRDRERQPPISPTSGGLVSVSFESIFSQYPKTDGYEEGRLVWAGMKLAPEEVWAIKSSLAVWMGSEDWRKEGGRFVCRLDNWLKNRGWEKLPREPAHNEDNSLEYFDPKTGRVLDKK